MHFQIFTPKFHFCMLQNSVVLRILKLIESGLVKLINNALYLNPSWILIGQTEANHLIWDLQNYLMMFNGRIHFSIGLRSKGL